MVVCESGMVICEGEGTPPKQAGEITIQESLGFIARKDNRQSLCVLVYSNLG